MSQVEVLYNGVCPVCREGACDLERRAAAAKAGVVFTDVSQNGDALKRAGLSLDQVRFKLHAIDANGRVLAGMPAVALAWAATSFGQSGADCAVLLGWRWRLPRRRSRSVGLESRVRSLVS